MFSCLDLPQKGNAMECNEPWEFCWDCATDCSGSGEIVYWWKHRMVLCPECYQNAKEDLFVHGQRIYEKNLHG